LFAVLDNIGKMIYTTARTSTIYVRREPLPDGFRVHRCYCIVETYAVSMCLW